MKPGEKILRDETIEFRGHIVHCLDVDSRDEFNIEVMIRSDITGDKLVEVCEKVAKNNELVMLSGNTFEYEYIMESGRVTRHHIQKVLLSDTSKEAQEILNQHHID